MTLIVQPPGSDVYFGNHKLSFQNFSPVLFDVDKNDCSLFAWRMSMYKKPQRALVLEIDN